MLWSFLLQPRMSTTQLDSKYLLVLAVALFVWKLMTTRCSCQFPLMRAISTLLLVVRVLNKELVNLLLLPIRLLMMPVPIPSSFTHHHKRLSPVLCSWLPLTPWTIVLKVTLLAVFGIGLTMASTDECSFLCAPLMVVVILRVLLLSCPCTAISRAIARQSLAFSEM